MTNVCRCRGWLRRTEIAARVDMSADRVGDWRRRFSEEGLGGLEKQSAVGSPAPFPPGRGRPRQGGGLRSASRARHPVSRFSRGELHRLVIERGVTDAPAATIARWLSEDALQPWQHRSWIVPTDPEFAERPGPVLDIYQGRWEGGLLHPGDFVICPDEKPSIQARARIHWTLPPASSSRGQRVEHTYVRMGPHLPGSARHRSARRQTTTRLRPLRAAGGDRRL